MTLNISIKNKSKTSKNFVIEMDANKFEKLAASFGFFNSAFLTSLDKAEKDYKSGRAQKIKSLKDLN